MDLHKLSWAGNLSVDVTSIDEQHRDLAHNVDIIELFYTTNINEKEQVYELFHQIIDDMETHFAWEERIMDNAKYPGIVRHTRIHFLILKKLKMIEARFANNSYDEIEKGIHFLKKIVVEHLFKEDLSFKNHLHR